MGTFTLGYLILFEKKRHFTFMTEEYRRTFHGGEQDRTMNNAAF